MRSNSSSARVRLIHPDVSRPVARISPNRWEDPAIRVRAGTIQRISEVDPHVPQVQIQGRARARQIIICPITGKPVIGYRTRIEALDSDGVWQVAVEMTRLREFIVHDDSGEALVHWLGPLMLASRRPTMELAQAVTGSQFYSLLNIDKKGFVSLLKLNTIAGTKVMAQLLSRTKRIRYWATILEHGTEVFVCGRPMLRINPRGAADGYRQPPAQLVLRSAGGLPLLLADGTKDALEESLGSWLID